MLRQYKHLTDREKHNERCISRIFCAKSRIETSRTVGHRSVSVPFWLFHRALSTSDSRQLPLFRSARVHHSIDLLLAWERVRKRRRRRRRFSRVNRDTTKGREVARSGGTEGFRGQANGTPIEYRGSEAKECRWQPSIYLASLLRPRMLTVLAPETEYRRRDRDNDAARAVTPSRISGIVTRNTSR